MRLLSALFIVVILFLSTATASAAEVSEIAQAIRGVKIRGEVIPQTIFNFPIVVDDATTVNVTTVVSGWGYKTKSCPNYPEGSGLAFITSMNNGELSAAAKIPTTRGGFLDVIITDADLNGRIEAGSDVIQVDSVIVPDRQLKEAQKIFDNVVRCFNSGG